ncbi:MAG TPA: glycosyltransferase [Rhizomicrobium sp.]|nr:glycosyltransferase [Rhizomicrobium sp.]
MSEAVWENDGEERAVKVGGPAARRAAQQELSAAVFFARAEALSEKGAAAADIVQQLVLFVGATPDGAHRNRSDFVMRHAHAAFREGLRHEAVILYDWLARGGQGNAMCEMRRAMWRQQNNDPQMALRIMDGLEASRPLDDKGALVKARALVALERYEEAVAPLKFVLAAKPGKLEAVRLLFAALEGAGDRNELREPEKFLEGMPADQQFEFLLQARLACEDYIGAAKLCSEYPASVAGFGLQRIGHIMHALVPKRDFETIDALFDAAGGAASASHAIISAKLRALLIRKELEAAERILREAEPLLNASSVSDLRLRKLEYFCLSMQLDRAVEYLDECMAQEATESAELPHGWTATAAGLYSARREWGKIFDLLHDRVRLGADIGNTPLLEAVGRAARYTGRYKEVIELLEEQLSRAPNEELENFRDRVLCERALVGAICKEEPSQGVGADTVIADPFLAERARNLSFSLSERERDERERTIYFCTDANYLAGTSVALHSLLRNNPALRRRCALNVICADNILDFAADIFRLTGAAFGVSIDVVPASAVRGTAGHFKREWGFFAVGHGLSAAAYYRIFAAQNLLARGIGGRALYIDSDTCVGHGVDKIFRFDLDGQPLGARLGIVAEISQAAAAIGVEPESYFNSGVLLFDLDHPALPAALARAAEFAHSRQDLLTFHDQCALNLAFAGCTTPLPEAFNWFLRATAPEEPAHEPVVLHFTANPKPWDPMYPTNHCMRWIREYVMLSDLLTPEMRVRLLTSQFVNLVSAGPGQGA